MNQLSVIYLIMGSVLVVGVMLISISPGSAKEVIQNPEAMVGISHIQSREASAPGLGKLSHYFAPNNKGQVNETGKFYTNTLPYTSGMITKRLIFDIIRKARGEDFDTPRPFLPPAH